MNTHSPWRDPGLRRIARALGSILLVSLLGAAPASAQPSNLTVTGVTASQIDLAWTGVAFATYNVYRDGSQIASGLGGTSYSDAGLSAFTEYDYYVTATVFGTESGPSNTVTQRTLDDSPPSIPAGLVATAVSTTQIDLVWSPSTDGETGISEYVVYRDGFEVGRSTSTSYSDTGLTASTVYQYRISAINGQGLESGQSGPENEKTLDPEPPLPSDQPVRLDGQRLGDRPVVDRVDRRRRHRLPGAPEREFGCRPRHHDVLPGLGTAGIHDLQLHRHRSRQRGAGKRTERTRPGHDPGRDAADHTVQPRGHGDGHDDGRFDLGGFRRSGDRRGQLPGVPERIRDRVNQPDYVPGHRSQSVDHLRLSCASRERRRSREQPEQRGLCDHARRIGTLDTDQPRGHAGRYGSQSI